MTGPLHLFEGFGVELEYMVVDQATLDVRPVVDEILRAATGAYVSDYEDGLIAWSNELVLHVIELKTNGPARELSGLAGLFDQNIRRIGQIIEPHAARLMPSAMHPWMNPLTQTRLWPHEYSPVYEAFNRIFDCRGHGWSNLQSVHLNLPFADDEEFGRLHAAIRLVLPILPALAASSPVCERRRTGLTDTRLDMYRSNAARIPAVTGRVIPEPVFTREAYEREILQPLYREIAPHDPEGVLQDEFLNARGAIARFCRNTIEIRVLDMQECPAGDLAVVAAVVALVRALCDQRWTSTAAQQAWPVEPLERILLACIRDGRQARISNADYLAALGWPGRPQATAGELWDRLIDDLSADRSSGLEPFAEPLGVFQRDGTLSDRIVRALGNPPAGEKIDPARLAAVYRELCDCLAAGRMFRP